MRAKTRRFDSRLFFAAVCWLASCHIAIAADESSAPTLLLPYPLTGPREIQASDRITRRYRVVAAHAAPPITDTMAVAVEAAVRVSLGQRLIRLRRDDAMAFQRLRMDRAAPDLLLAGDDLLRASDLEEMARTGRLGDLPALLDPLASMPFVLLCAVPSCGAIREVLGGRANMGPRMPRSIASAGEISTSHIAAQTFTRHLGLASLLVPYAGGNAVMSAIVSGQVDAAFVALPLALGYIRHEKVRSLAVSSERRFQRLPELPTMREQGVPVVVEAWFALFGSARLNTADAARIAAAVRAYRLDPAFLSKWTAQGLVPVMATAEEFSREVRGARSSQRRAQQ